ncbi:hypothetical protein PV08_06885 [Exophiala spinifera]|uniref:Uncharacterized protein n=1 Tax=Exophiala spinifera TaxID=91928 RepID=A0A0D2BSB0_9EURO|nr:uncharacterized protein PV08_06885 [Exophiala spinifera]KIW14104.1 hypothetical protein PV08_06885 [Exophiala spinifera]
MQHPPLPKHPSWTPPPVQLYTRQDYDGGDIVTSLSRNELGEYVFTIGLLSPDPSSHQTAHGHVYLPSRRRRRCGPLDRHDNAPGHGDHMDRAHRVQKYAPTAAKRGVVTGRPRLQPHVGRLRRHMVHAAGAQLSDPGIKDTARVDSTFYMATGGPEKLTPEMPGSNCVLERQMRAADWCDADANLLDLKLGSLEKYFASFLDATRAEELTGVLLGPPSKAEVPLVGAGDPRLGEDRRLYASLEPSTRTRSVAISHVCSDGLGNNLAGAIPLCEFERPPSWRDQFEGLGASGSK